MDIQALNWNYLSTTMITGTLVPGLEVAISISIQLSASLQLQIHLLQLAMDTDLCHKSYIIHCINYSKAKQNKGNTLI